MDASRDECPGLHGRSPGKHWTQIASTNPLERVNREVKPDVPERHRHLPQRRGHRPTSSARSCSRPTMNGPWRGRYMSLETLARVTDNPTVRLPAVAS